MQITAAVVRSRSGAFQIEKLDLCDPRAGNTTCPDRAVPFAHLPRR